MWLNGKTKLDRLSVSRRWLYLGFTSECLWISNTLGLQNSSIDLQCPIMGFWWLLYCCWAVSIEQLWSWEQTKSWMTLLAQGRSVGGWMQTGSPLLLVDFPPLPTRSDWYTGFQHTLVLALGISFTGRHHGTPWLYTAWRLQRTDKTTDSHTKSDNTFPLCESAQWTKYSSVYSYFFLILSVIFNTQSQIQMTNIKKERQETRGDASKHFTREKVEWEEILAVERTTAKIL